MKQFVIACGRWSVLMGDGAAGLIRRALPAVLLAAFAIAHDAVAATSAASDSVDVARNTLAKRQSETGVVARKLLKCDFLLNKGFKKNARYYLCLFSASWCGPCRREMPRIAKIYAESLKDDSEVELIHFSCDRNDDKAIEWAKEHDVKFPVVKPGGGNPLNLQPRGIPHLFIVKADGTLLDEGHPMQKFTDETLNALKSGNGLKR